MSIGLLLRRAFVSNLRQLTASDAERSRLAADGVTEPTVQGYFAWRKSLMAMVVLTTVLSAGLATYRELTETDETPTLFDTLSEKVTETAEEAMSADDEEETASAFESAADQLTRSAAVATANQRLQQVDENDEAEADKPMPLIGQIVNFIEVAALYALAISAFIALRMWTRFRASSQVLLMGFLISFFVPMLVGFLPYSWWGDENTSADFREDPTGFLRDTAADLLMAAEYMVSLLPTVLSLIPGVQRACLRIKTLLPEAVLPGWYLVAAAPLYGLFLFVIFVGVNQVASNPVFLVGLFLFLVAPAMYVVRADVFTRPLVTDADFQQMRRVQKVIAMITLTAGVLLLYFVTSQSVMGIRVVGWDAKSSLLQPLDLVEFVLEFLARSMFMTVFGADLILRMTLMNWRQTQSLQGTANRHESIMTAFGAAK